MVAKATTPEIQVAEETRASLSQGVACGEARMLELACTSWAATSGLYADFEDDEEGPDAPHLGAWDDLGAPGL
jgi:hypothetical protein